MGGVVVCWKKRYIGFAWTSPAHRHSDYSPHLGGHHPVGLLGVGTPLYTSTLRHGIYYIPRSNFTVALSTKFTQKNTHPTRQPCRQNSGYPAPISGHPFIVLLTAHHTMYSLGLDCWPCGSRYIHPGHACMPCPLLELGQMDVETMQRLYRRFLWPLKKKIIQCERQKSVQCSVARLQKKSVASKIKNYNAVGHECFTKTKAGRHGSVC